MKSTAAAATTPDKTARLKYRVTFGPQCKDRDSYGAAIQYFMKPVHTTARWTKTTGGDATNGGSGNNNNKNSKKGLWSDSLKEWAKPTPFANIVIDFSDQKENDGNDEDDDETRERREKERLQMLESVEEISVSMGCEVHVMSSNEWSANRV